MSLVSSFIYYYFIFILYFFFSFFFSSVDFLSEIKDLLLLLFNLNLRCIAFQSCRPSSFGLHVHSTMRHNVVSA